MHERTVNLCQQLASDLNSDYAALFNEKKYKELQLIAGSVQSNILGQLKAQILPVYRVIAEASILSRRRQSCFNN